MKFEVIRKISEIDAAAWNALVPDGYPFASHAYLRALETTGCIGEQTGWLTQHALLFDGDQLIAAAPGYLKTHSYGEFVFDFAWADAAARVGLPYYPKWLIAMPFAPVSGERLFAASEADRAQLLDAMLQHAKENKLPGLHALFCNPRDQALMAHRGMLHRQDCQYIWHNRDFSSFDDYLATLGSRDRKKIRRERRRVAEAGVQVTPVKARDISASDWDTLYQCYASTYLARGQHPYWTAGFLRQLALDFPDELLIFTARRESQIIAAAITLQGADSLYGRHWGCLEQVDSLHFETCYYRCIEYCIAQGLSVFDAGAQGEHKMRRGFEPVATHSMHWLQNERLSNAVADFLLRERAAVGQYIEYCEVRTGKRAS